MKNINYVSRVDEECEEKEKTKAENEDRVIFKDETKSQINKGVEIIENQKKSKELERHDDLKVETMLKNLSISNIKHKIVLVS